MASSLQELRVAQKKSYADCLAYENIVPSAARRTVSARLWDTWEGGWWRRSTVQ